MLLQFIKERRLFTTSMWLKDRTKILFAFGIVFALMYSTILGGSGVIERARLESKLQVLSDDVIRLEAENTRLEKKKFNPSQDVIMNPEYSYVIKFKEFIEFNGVDGPLATHIPLSRMENKQARNFISNMNLVKSLYLIAGGIFAAGFIYRRKMQRARA